MSETLETELKKLAKSNLKLCTARSHTGILNAIITKRGCEIGPSVESALLYQYNSIQEAEHPVKTMRRSHVWGGL